MKLPTQSEIDATYMQVEAECAQRAAEFTAKMRQMGRITKVNEVDVMREPLPVRPPQPPSPPPAPEALCQFCPKTFTSKTVGLAVSLRNKHVKRDHKGQSIAR